MEVPQSTEKKLFFERHLQDPYAKAGTVQDLSDRRTSIISKEGEIINASGHRDQLQRQYGLRNHEIQNDINILEKSLTYFSLRMIRRELTSHLKG